MKIYDGERTVIHFDNGEKLDLASIEDWQRDEHLDALRAAVRVASDTTRLRLVTIGDTRGALVWEFANKATLIPINEAKAVFIELSLLGLRFLLDEDAGKMITAALTPDDEANIEAAIRKLHP